MLKPRLDCADNLRQFDTDWVGTWHSVTTELVLDEQPYKPMRDSMTEIPAPNRYVRIPDIKIVLCNRGFRVRSERICHSQD